MANRDDNRSTKELSRSSTRVLIKLSPVKTEEPELNFIKFPTKRSSACLDGSLTLKNEDPNRTLHLWRGNNVGREAKQLFETIEHCYPTTFQRVNVRVTPFWLNNLKELHTAIKRFMGSPVDALMEEQITGFHQDFKDLEGLGFDLSWAHKRLEMVARLKFGNEPLQNEWMALEESLGPRKERVDEIMEHLMKAHDMYMRALSDYENATKARNKKVEEMIQEFGPDFDRVLKDRLGFGMLRGY